MNKEEILEKSRRENKGHDLAEQTERRKNWQASFIAAVIAIAVVICLQFMTGHDDESCALIFVIFAMDFGMFLRQAIKRRKASDIGMMLVFGIIMIMAFVRFIRYLLK